VHPGQPEEPKHQRPGFNSTEGASSLKDDTSSYTPCIGLRTFQPQPPKWPPSRVICGWVLAACPSSEETTCCVLHATVWSMCSIGMRMSARPGLTRRPAEAVRPMEGGGCVVGVARGQGTCPCMSTRAQGPPHSSSLHRRVAWVAWTAPRCRVKGRGVGEHTSMGEGCEKPAERQNICLQPDPSPGGGTEQVRPSPRPRPNAPPAQGLSRVAMRDSPRSGASLREE
jgi:hypothetical protein